MLAPISFKSKPKPEEPIVVLSEIITFSDNIEFLIITLFLIIQLFLFSNIGLNDGFSLAPESKQQKVFEAVSKHQGEIGDIVGLNLTGNTIQRTEEAGNTIGEITDTRFDVNDIIGDINYKASVNELVQKSQEYVENIINTIIILFGFLLDDLIANGI